MRAWIIAVLLVLVGIVAAWAGYWIGHFAGWSRDAEWPLRIGGGEGAILLSIGLSFLSVWMVGLWLIAWPLVRMRRLLASGTPGQATIVRVWRTGVRISRITGTRRQLGFELTVHPASGVEYTAQALGLASADEEAAYRPGVEVNVRIDPSKRTAVAVEGPVSAPAA